MQDSDLEAILAELLEAEELGETPNIEALVQRNPDYAEELLSFLANRDYLRRFAGSPGHATHLPAPPPTPRPAEASVATTRVGDYELVDQIACGGMGVVYRARHAVLGRLVALKMIRDGRFASEAQRQRFLLEARAAARLDHPNIVPLYEVGEQDAQPYFTMKLVEGPSLADHLASWIEHPRESVQVVLTLARAVHYAHQRGIMHRDLKPANILLEETGGSSDVRAEGLSPPPAATAPQQRERTDERSESAAGHGWRPIITDFGLAKLQDSEGGLTHSGAVLGTPAYMAPEQATGSGREVATTTDIYSLGAILYALLTGRPPLGGSSPTDTLYRVIHQTAVPPSRLNRAVDRDLETVCLKCLEKDPRHRYGSAEALADDLERWLTNRPILARPSSPLERTIKWARRKPIAASLVAVSIAALVLSAVGSVLWWHNGRLREALVETERQRAEATRQQDRAVRLQNKLKYVRSMNRANQAWSDGQLGQALALLEGQRHDPQQTKLRNFEWFHLWHLCHERLKETLRPKCGSIRALALVFEPQRTLAGTDQGLVLIDPQGIQQLASSPVHSLAVSPRGDVCASLDDQGLLTAWNLSEGVSLWTKKLRRPYVTSTTLLAFSPDGRYLAAGSSLFELDSGACLAQLESTTNALAWAPNGRFLVGGNNDRDVTMWDLQPLDSDEDHSPALPPDGSKSPVPQPRATRPPAVPAQRIGQHRVYVRCVAVSPDSTSIASGSEDGIVRRWDSATHKLIAEHNAHAGEVYALAFSPDGNWLASGGEDGVVALKHLVSGEIRQHPHLEPVRGIAFTPDNRFVTSAGDDGAIKVWQVDGSPPPHVLRGHTELVRGVAFSPDGNQLASCGNDLTVRLWDVSSGRPTGTLRGHSGPVTHVAFSPDGATLASANSVGNQAPADPEGAHGYVQLWDARTQTLRSTLPAHSSATWYLAFSPDGSLLATAGYLDRCVRVWDVATGKLRHTLTGLKNRNFCVAFAPNGKWVASGGADDVAHVPPLVVWDLDRNGLRIPFDPDLPWVWSVAFSPDSGLLATGSNGGRVKLWDMASGNEAVTIEGHTSAARSVAFFPSGETLVSASDDRTVKLWDVVTGEERATLRGHTESAWCVAVSPDGHTIASGSRDGTVRLWRAATEADVLRQSSSTE